MVRRRRRNVPRDRDGFTPAQRRVYDAAEALAAAGRVPFINLIARELGRGRTTVAERVDELRALRRWRWDHLIMTPAARAATAANRAKAAWRRDRADAGDDANTREKGEDYRPDIAAATAAIRERWSDAQRRQREACPARPWAVPGDGRGGVRVWCGE